MTHRAPEGRVRQLVAVALVLGLVVGGALGALAAGLVWLSNL
ncbi:hypothetical protein GCM10010149_47630 [Nonomuraea roseoviolacea subsp. roseoviolacea]